MATFDLAGHRTDTAPAGDVLTSQALEVARREAALEAGDAAAVGDLIDTVDEGDDAVTVRFAADVEGYRGWQWSVTVAMPRSGHATVSEVMLLPGNDALLAPAWVPWKERVRGGDLGVGDLLPPPPDDPRIVPAYVQSDDPAVEHLAREIGLGRVRVLSRDGRLDATARWHDGDFGPMDDMARHAPGACATCAFYVPLAGLLGAGFGACANEFSPADGRVVDAAYGCGAHSEVRLDQFGTPTGAGAVVDELRLDVYRRDDAAVGPLPELGDDAASAPDIGEGDDAASAADDASPDAG